MKSLICSAALALTLSAPVFATGDHEACDAVGMMAQIDLYAAKNGINTYESLANNDEKMAEYGVDDSALFLIVAQTMWENRKTYNDAKAYKVGYKLCMELK